MYTRVYVCSDSVRSGLEVERCVWLNVLRRVEYQGVEPHAVRRDTYNLLSRQCVCGVAACSAVVYMYASLRNCLSPHTNVIICRCTHTQLH